MQNRDENCKLRVFKMISDCTLRFDGHSPGKACALRGNGWHRYMLLRWEQICSNQSGNAA